MKDCLSPFFPDFSLQDRISGLARYPEVDERLGLENGPRALPCNRCENCYNTRRRRWVGRALAELSTSDAGYFCTCTYGNDPHYRLSREKHPHPHAYEFHLEDGQKWLKRVRRAGHRLSYLWVFERGTLKGRVHLHALLFFRGYDPEIQLGQHYSDRFWKDGLVDYKRADEANIAYLCNYILPDGDDDSSDRSFRKSTVPPLGTQFFDNRARGLVEQGLAPQDSVYSIAGCTVDYGKLKGLPKLFTLGDAARDRFLASYVRQWRELRPGDALPESGFVDAYLDRVARAELVEGRMHDNASWANLRRRGSYFSSRDGAAMPGRFRERG